MTISSDSMQGEEFELTSKPMVAGQQFSVNKEVVQVGEVSKLSIR